jgi:hypothetical protein
MRKTKSLERFRTSAVARSLFFAALAATGLIASESRIARAETCTTQSGLAEPERDALAEATRTLAAKIQANEAAGLRAVSVAELQKDFGALQYLVAVTAPKVAGGTPTLEQVYLLDSASSKPNPDGSAPDAQFFCSLNRSTMEADFVIPSLPSGKYGFAIVNVAAPSSATQPATAESAARPSVAPWRLSFLLRQEQGKWLLAGFYPKPLTAAGHDGLWYWTQARQMTKDKQPWNAWLYYQAAANLLRPADFVLSTHLDKLRTEIAAAAPPALSEGVSPDAPLVVKAASGAEYHFTGLSVDDSLGQSSLDIAVHLHVDPAADAIPDAKPNARAAATPDPRQRNSDAMSALLAAYPEMRKPFHGIHMYADTTGQSPFATEQSMADIK